MAGEVSDTEKFVTIISNELSKATGEKIMTGAEQLMQKGMLEGERKILIQLVNQRFGSISPGYAEKIAHSDAEMLELFVKRILDAKKIEDVFGQYQ